MLLRNIFSSNVPLSCIAVQGNAGLQYQYHIFVSQYSPCNKKLLAGFLITFSYHLICHSNQLLLLRRMFYKSIPYTLLYKNRSYSFRKRHVMHDLWMMNIRKLIQNSIFKSIIYHLIYSKYMAIYINKTKSPSVCDANSRKSERLDLRRHSIIKKISIHERGQKIRE